MSPGHFAALPLWAMILSLCLHSAAGIMLGVIYFRSLWRSARGFVGGGQLVTNIVSTIGRFVILGGVLVLASLEGALPLLAMSFGILVARFEIMRRFKRAA